MGGCGIGSRLWRRWTGLTVSDVAFPRPSQESGRQDRVLLDLDNAEVRNAQGQVVGIAAGVRMLRGSCFGSNSGGCSDQGGVCYRYKAVKSQRAKVE